MFRTKLKTGAVLAAAVLLVAAGAGVNSRRAWADKPAAREAEKKDDRANLQGSWAAVAGEQDGQKLPDESLKQVRVTFDGDEVTFQPKRDKSRVTFQLATTGTPRGITMTAREG